MNTESNHIDWLNKGPWYNRNICSKLHGIRFEDFITQARTDLYNLMCYLVAHYRLQPYYEYNIRSIGDREISNDAIIKHQKNYVPLLILLIYDLNCFVKIIVTEVRYISML